MPDDKLYVPRSTFDKLVKGSEKITKQFGEKLATSKSDISKLEFDLAKQKNKSLMLQEELDKVNKQWEDED